ncbi:MAG: spore cortex biosynthesis protein YabQ [Clostridiales bacterium]|nr:spore cortex biosynthesis protein YabQ [Clostridiales bacterium]
MIYLPTIADQTKVFMLSLGMGFILGILYDIFRIIRLIITDKPKAFILQDILYFVVCTLVSFLFLLSVNNGKVRSFELAGEILGWLVYYFSFGTVAIRFGNLVISAVKRFLKFVFRIFIRPITNIFSKITGFFKKIIKFFIKKLKFLLKFYTRV